MSDVMIPAWTLGDRLAKARQAAGIPTATEMAKLLGVTERTIRNWESGATRVADPTIIAYAAITGVPRWWIEGLPDPDDAEPVVTQRERAATRAVYDSTPLAA